MMIIRRKSMNQGVLMRDITISTPFTTRETAGGKILNRSLAEITSITGNTLVLNQLANNSEEVHLAGASKVNVTTFTKAEFGEKLYIKLKIKKESVITFVDPGVSTTEELSLRVGDANNGLRIMLIDDVPVDAEYHTLSAIVTNNNSDNDTLVIKSTNLDEIYAKDAIIINLTRMYGSGNEPTLKEFEQAYPLDYYEQTDGRLLDFKGTTLVSKDSSENVLDTVSLDVTTLTGKLCEKIFPDGLKRAGNVYDEIKVENGLLYAIKRVGSVNLGNLTTTYLTVSDVNFFQCTIPNADMLPSTPNITSSRYLSTNVPFGDVSNMYVKPHDTIGNYIYIRNDSYTTEASFKTAMSGVLLYYELATELRYLIDTTDPYIAKYKVDGWGTEEIVLDTNACSPSMTINYPDSSTENTRFTYRKTADGTKLNVNGDAFITNIKGETVAWNQLLENGNFADTNGWSAIGSSASLSVSNNIATITKKYNAMNIGGVLYRSIANLNTSHKYYLSCIARTLANTHTLTIGFYNTNGTEGGNTLTSTNSTSYTKLSHIASPKSNANVLALRCGISSSATGVQANVYSCMCVDLTLIYGKGNEPTTTDAFEADYLKWFGKPLTYEAYDAGSLKPAKMVSIKTVGFNAADYDEMKVGSDNYTYTYNGYYCKSFKLLPNTTYRIRKKASSYGNVVLLINNGSYINSGNYFDTRSSSSYSKDYTTNSSGLLYIGVVSGTSAQVKARLEEIDLQIYLINNDSRNGYYESHWHNTSMLNVTELKGIAVNNGEPTGNLVTIFPDGMKSAGSVYDYIGKENRLWVAYKRVGSVDLSTLSWSVYGNYSYILRSKFSNAKQVPSITVVPNATISNGYSVNNLNTVILNQNLDRSFSIGNPYDGNSIIIHDSRYNSSTINEALDGVILNYELATPQKYILDNTMHWLYKIDQQGVEEILPQNTSIPTTSPAKLNIKYKTIKPTQLIKVSQTNTNLRSCRVLYGLPYSVRILPYDGFSLYEDPIIKMGGVDITSTAYDATYNMISIASVTDDVDIECYAMYSIPSDYIRVDGIKNPSNAWMDTGYTTSYKNIITVDFQKSTTGYVFATKATGNTNVKGSVVRIYADGNIMYDTNASGARSAGQGSSSGRNTIIFKHYKGSASYSYAYLNGSRILTYDKASYVDAHSLCLFQTHVTAGQASSAGMIIYFFSIFDGTTNAYVRYYIPCLNTSGVAGFWDAARGVFQGSINSTTFEAVAADGGDFRLINFEDSAVKNICVTNWGGHYKTGEMYTPEARAVTSLGNKFENNKTITKFNELQYFTGLTTLSRYVSGQYIEGGNYFGAFNRCSNLEEVTLPTISIQGDTRIAGLFLRCTSLKTIDMSPITVTSGANLYSICRGCTSLTSAILPSVTVSASYIHFMYAFDVCSNITTIDASNVIFTADHANNSASFAGCSKLTRIIGGLSGWKQTNNMSACPLTHDAAVELLESLGTVTTARTLTLKTSTYNTLTAEEKAIATNKGWTLNYG